MTFAPGLLPAFRIVVLELTGADAGKRMGQEGSGTTPAAEFAALLWSRFRPAIRL